jgi:hypothetical protein
MKLQKSITDFILSNENSPYHYDPLNCHSVQTFKPIKMNTGLKN